MYVGYKTDKFIRELTFGSIPRNVAEWVSYFFKKKIRFAEDRKSMIGKTGRRFRKNAGAGDFTIVYTHPPVHSIVN